MEKSKNMTGAKPVYTGLNFIEACKKCMNNVYRYVLQGENSFADNYFAFYNPDINSFIIFTQKKIENGHIVKVPVTDFTKKTEAPLEWCVTSSTATDTYSLYFLEDLDNHDDY